MAASPNQRGWCSRPSLLFGVVIVLLFVCAVLMKISSERAKEIVELEALLLDSRQTIDNENRERDLATLARKEVEAELQRVRNSAGNIQNQKKQLTAEVDKLKNELGTCKQESETATAQREESQRTLRTEKDKLDKKIDELTKEKDRLATEKAKLEAENKKLQHQLQDAKQKPTEPTEPTNTPNTEQR